MSNLSKTVAMLIERMNDHPNEFVFDGRDAADDSLTELVYGSRWQSITESILQNNHIYKVFTDEEVEAYQSKLAEILRKKVEEDVCRELLTTEETDERQLELFPNQTAYPPKGKGNSVLTINRIQAEAMKILNGQIDEALAKDKP